MTERDAPETLVCEDLDRAIALFAQLGLRLDTISPADDPSVALLSGPGTRVRLVRAASFPAAGREAAVRGAGAEVSIGGSSDVSEPPAPFVPSLVVVRASDSPWHTGRAGMLYRDLIPDRQGGRIIASHIRIPDGGPVPDYVHYHAIELQLIYCHRGWVRVVYEDQGVPFVLAAGDCVLQPPGIRHRVLEASPGLEVIELGVPAMHPTHVEHDLALPTPHLRPDRDFGGQRFVHFRAATAHFTPSPIAGFEACELGIAAATRGRASVHVLRPSPVARGATDPLPPGATGLAAPGATDPLPPGGTRLAAPGGTDPLPPGGTGLAARGGTGLAAPRTYRHTGELLFHVVLRGELTLDGACRLTAADAFVIPSDQPFKWSEPSPDLELLSVALPAADVKLID